MQRQHGYSGLQIGIHWIVAVLIFAVHFTCNGMGRALRTRIEAGETHEVNGNALMIVVLGHALISIGHDIIWGDGTLKRMIRPEA